MTPTNRFQDDRGGEGKAPDHPAPVLDEPTAAGHDEPGQRAAQPEQRHQHAADLQNRSKRGVDCQDQTEDPTRKHAGEHVAASDPPVGGAVPVAEPRPDLEHHADQRDQLVAQLINEERYPVLSEAVAAGLFDPPLTVEVADPRAEADVGLELILDGWPP
jgi:hypothetical protein